MENFYFTLGIVYLVLLSASSVWIYFLKKEVDEKQDRINVLLTTMNTKEISLHQKIRELQQERDALEFTLQRIRIRYNSLIPELRDYPLL